MYWPVFVNIQNFKLLVFTSDHRVNKPFLPGDSDPQLLQLHVFVPFASIIASLKVDVETAMPLCLDVFRFSWTLLFRALVSQSPPSPQPFNKMLRAVPRVVPRPEATMPTP